MTHCRHSEEEYNDDEEFMMYARHFEALPRNPLLCPFIEKGCHEVTEDFLPMDFSHSFEMTHNTHNILRFRSESQNKQYKKTFRNSEGSFFYFSDALFSIIITYALSSFILGSICLMISSSFNFSICFV